GPAVALILRIGVGRGRNPAEPDEREAAADRGRAEDHARARGGRRPLPLGRSVPQGRKARQRRRGRKRFQPDPGRLRHRVRCTGPRRVRLPDRGRPGARQPVL
ncbi:MAG: hypothetical protein AVDCRST_MAG93-870, partial [uncultured Chloroflexia bacterium]